MLYKRLSLGIVAMREEMKLRGTNEGWECLQYLLGEEAGSRKKVVQASFRRDCDAEGEVLPERLNKEDRRICLQDWTDHDHPSATTILQVIFEGVLMVLILLRHRCRLWRAQQQGDRW